MNSRVVKLISTQTFITVELSSTQQHNMNTFQIDWKEILQTLQRWRIS